MSQFPSDQSSKLSGMGSRRLRRRVLAAVISFIAVPLTMQLEQARINYVVQATIAGLRHSLRVHLPHSPPRTVPAQDWR
jgi:hypothetical protein